MSFSIRQAKPSDAERWEAIHAAGWEYAYRGILNDDYLDAQITKFLNSVQRRKEFIGTDKGINLVAVDDEDNVIGICGGHIELLENGQKNFHLGGLYLEPSYIGQGMGKELFAAFARQVKNLGGSEFTVGCLAQNKSCGFYEKLGGKVVKTEFFQNQTELFFEFDVNSLI